MNFNDWDSSLREFLQDDNSPVSLNSGRYWEVNDKFDSLFLVKDRIFDKHLDVIKEISVDVLSEKDPKFELEPDKHYMASIYDKKLRYSNNLREGLAETLVWLGINGDMLINCSPDKRRYIARIAIRDIFEDASWQLWGSLNYLLPTLAEADPDEFLNIVEYSLRQKPSPFDELFRQEGDGITGSNYLTGLYWALEGLAWDEKYLGRVCVVLAEIAEHDPGGRWANRPSNSLIDILLPWHPQTLAPIENRIAAFQAICKDSPTVAWKVVLALLPNSHQATTGCHKPKWRNPIAEDWKPEVLNKDYWAQVEQYAEIAIEMVREDLDKTKQLVGNMDNLPKTVFESFLSHLASENIIGLPLEDRTPIWEKLTEFVNKHRRYSDAKWALPEEIVDKIDSVADKLKPETGRHLYKRLFGNRSFDLYEENGDWRKQEEKLRQERKNAIKLILYESGVKGVIDFVAEVESPRLVGSSLGEIKVSNADQEILPDILLTKDDKIKEFIGDFVWSRNRNLGWGWVVNIDKSGWSKEQIAQFLMFLPFCSETWKGVKEWLSDNEELYWKYVYANPYQTEDDLIPAIDKLLEFDQPLTAIDCLYNRIYEKHQIDIERSIEALSKAVSSSEVRNSMNMHHATDLITALQNEPLTPMEDICLIEWQYLPLLQHNGNKGPKCLNNRLSTEPEFFCEIISYIYKAEGEANKDEDPEKTAIATNAWYLLHEWDRPPGVTENGEFSEEKFLNWVNKSKDLCKDARRLDVAMISLGKVLYYVPKDPDGFWIHKSVLPVLNDRNSDSIRDGFSTEIFNSRGVHWVDPTGKPERELAKQWRERAKVVEKESFPRFASVLRDVADSYDRETERIISEHTKSE